MSVRDAYIAIRAWRRRPMLAAIAISTIGIGIGAATAIYSVVDGVLLRPLPLPEPNRIVAVWQTYPQWRTNAILAPMWDRISLSQPEFHDLVRLQRSFTSIGIWSGGRALLTVGDRAEDVRTMRASASLLATLGVSTFMGRTFSPDEDTPRGARVVLMSYELWQNRFAGARDILGRVVTLDDVPHTVVGILPPGLTLGRTTQSSTAGPSASVAFWTPVSYDSVDYYERTNHSYFAIGRLRPGVSIATAQSEVSRILVPTDKAALDKGVRLAEWQRDQTRDFRAPLYVLLAAAGLLLAIACINVATLLLGEAATREQEMAARAALGASTGRLVMQLLTESLTLALGGLALGVVLAWWGTRLLVSLAPARIPGIADVHVDMRVLGASLAATLVTGLLFGLAPAASLSRARPGSLFRGGGQSARGGAAIQRTLIAVELALSVVLLVGAGLLTRTLQQISRVDAGFRTDHLIVDTPGFPRVAGRDTNLVRAFRSAVLARLAAIPGVTAVTAGDGPPFSGRSSSTTILPEGTEPQAPGGGPRDVGPRHEVQQRVTVPGYFAAIGIPLREGRDFTAEDRAGAPLVAIVSGLAARREFPNQPVLGKRVKYQGEWRTIVGVVDDIHMQRLSVDVQPTIYTPVAQRRGAWVLSLLVRTAGDPGLVAPQVRKVVAELAPPAATQTIETMTVMLNRSFAEERYRSLLVSLFGIVAAVLAAVGIYGVTSRAVSRRMRELAIRSALGATARSIALAVIAASSVGAVIGIGVGLIGARLGSRVLTPFLFGVTAGDAPTYAVIFGLLASVTLAASYFPALRASKVNIASVLRGD